MLLLLLKNNLLPLTIYEFLFMFYLTGDRHCSLTGGNLSFSCAQNTFLQRQFLCQLLKQMIRKTVLYLGKNTFWGNRISIHMHWCLKKGKKKRKPIGITYQYSVSQRAPKLKAVLLLKSRDTKKNKTFCCPSGQYPTLQFPLPATVQISLMLINDKTITLIMSDRLTPYLT